MRVCKDCTIFWQTNVFSCQPGQLSPPAIAIIFSNLDGIAMDHTKKPGDYGVSDCAEPTCSGEEMRETHSNHPWYRCGS
jgi:hypothetical protein